MPLKELSNAYTGTIYIEGDPVKCIFDTGSTNTWIYKEHIPSFKPIDYSCSIMFGSGKLQGHFGSADITIGGITIKDQVFGKVESGEIFDDEFDCIVGLAYPAMKAGKDWHEPLFDNLMKLGINSFQFNLGENPSLDFNPTHNIKSLEWIPVVNQLFWSLELDSVVAKYGEK